MICKALTNKLLHYHQRVISKPKNLNSVLGYVRRNANVYHQQRNTTLTPLKNACMSKECRSQVTFIGNEKVKRTLKNFLQELDKKVGGQHSDTAVFSALQRRGY